MTRVAVALAAAVMAAAGPARACMSPCQAPSVNEAYEGAAAVFFGKVVKRDDQSMTDRLAVKVLKSWKGAAKGQVSVEAASTTCDPFGDMATPGQEVLIFAASRADGLATGVCRGSVVFGGAVKKADYLPRVDAAAGEPDAEQARCEKAGGRWGGAERGRGRVPGCHEKTGDGGRECADSSQCQSACLEDDSSRRGGRCFGWTHYRGCGILVVKNGEKRVMCVD